MALKRAVGGREPVGQDRRQRVDVMQEGDHPILRPDAKGELMALPPDIEAAIDATLKPSRSLPTRSRIWSEEEYYADITAPMSALLPPLPPDAEAAMSKAIAVLVAIFADTPPRKAGRSVFSPGIIQHDLIRLRNGDIAFRPSVGTVLVNKAWREVTGERAARAK